MCPPAHSHADKREERTKKKKKTTDPVRRCVRHESLLFREERTSDITSRRRRITYNQANFSSQHTCLTANFSRIKAAAALPRITRVDALPDGQRKSYEDAPHEGRREEKSFASSQIPCPEGSPLPLRDSLQSFLRPSLPLKAKKRDDGEQRRRRRKQSERPSEAEDERGKTRPISPYRLEHRLLPLRELDHAGTTVNSAATDCQVYDQVCGYPVERREQ